MNWESIKGIVERLLYVIAAYAAGKGWIAQSDAASFVALALGLVGVVFGWYFNTPGSLLAAAKVATPQASELLVVPKPGQVGAIDKIVANIDNVATAPLTATNRVPNPRQ